MAFFGLTQLGYQNPIGDKMIVNPRGQPPPEDGRMNAGGGSAPSFQELLQPPSYSTGEHHGSHKLHNEMVKRAQTTRSPDQLYIMPLTDNQQYGWMLSKSSEPWARVRQFPRRISEITKFVNDMSMKDPEFSLF